MSVGGGVGGAGERVKSLFLLSLHFTKDYTLYICSIVHLYSVHFNKEAGCLMDVISASRSDTSENSQPVGLRCNPLAEWNRFKVGIWLT